MIHIQRGDNGDGDEFIFIPGQNVLISSDACNYGDASKLCIHSLSEQQAYIVSELIAAGVTNYDLMAWIRKERV